MSELRVGVIGTGKNYKSPSAMGYGMAYQHGFAYEALPAGEVKLVACADIVKENADAYAEKFKIPGSGVYTDYAQMLAAEKLDLVSICTWPQLHAKMVLDTANAKVKGIFCEKPVAYNWGDCKQMHARCTDNRVKLAFNHQRRYGKPFRLARKLIDDGAIGKLQCVQSGAGDLYDYGTHNFDLCNFLNGDQRAKWVLAQIDYRTVKLVFGAHVENQGLVQWEYENGVYGLIATGPGARLINAHHRAVGSDGIIEIGSYDPVAKDKHLRIRSFSKGGDWEYIDTAGENCHGPGYIERAVAEFVAGVRTGTDSEVGSANALKATEIIFAAYQSSRVHGRVDLPLTIEDHPLVSMLECGVLRPQAAPK